MPPSRLPNAAVAVPLARPAAGDGLMETDGELLRLFTRHGDTAAFDKLVERHSTMVWRVCRQSLRRQQDAEDAFQATFLLLVKSARQIGASESAAGWLFRVAYRTSLRARKRLASRREEALALDPTAPSEIPFPDLTTRQHLGVLAEELMQLPLRYQTPLVMRYVEGQSRRAIAEATDVTVATVQGRLARGKQLLRSRLVRRGVSLSVAVGVLASNPRAEAAVASTPLVLQTTTNAAALATGGSFAASTAVVYLLEQGTRAMLFASLTKPAAVAAACGLAALVLAAPPTNPTATAPSEGVVLTATIEGEEAEAPTATINLAATEPTSDREPEALAPGVATVNNSAVVRQEVYLVEVLERALSQKNPDKDVKANLDSLAATLANAIGVERDAIRTFAKNRTIVVGADQPTHERLAAYLKKVRSEENVAKFVSQVLREDKLPTSDNEPKASAPEVAASPVGVTATIQEAPASLDLQFGDMALNDRKLSDAEQNELLRKQWAEAAKQDPPPANGEPSFKELHTWHTYWQHQYDALRNQLRTMTAANEKLPGAVHENEVQTVAAEIFKARAETLRYERELKLLALKAGEPGALATEVAVQVGGGGAPSGSPRIAESTSPLAGASPAQAFPSPDASQIAEIRGLIRKLGIDWSPNVELSDAELLAAWNSPTIAPLRQDYRLKATLGAVFAKHFGTTVTVNGEPGASATGGEATKGMTYARSETSPTYERTPAPPLSFGDQLDLSTWGAGPQAAYAGSGSIGPDGAFEFGTIKVKGVAGKTLDEAQAIIADHVRKQLGDPTVQVRIGHPEFGYAWGAAASEKPRVAKAELQPAEISAPGAATPPAADEAADAMNQLASNLDKELRSFADAVDTADRILTLSKSVDASMAEAMQQAANKAMQIAEFQRATASELLTQYVGAAALKDKASLKAATAYSRGFTDTKSQLEQVKRDYSQQNQGKAAAAEPTEKSKPAEQAMGASLPGAPQSSGIKARTPAPQRVTAFEAVRVPVSPEAPIADVSPQQGVIQWDNHEQIADQAAASAVLMKEQLAAFERAAEELSSGANRDKPAVQQMLAQLDAMKGQMQQQLQALQAEGQQGRKLRQEIRIEAIEEQRTPNEQDVLRAAPAPQPERIEEPLPPIEEAVDELETLRQQNQILRAELDAMRSQLQQSSFAFADARTQWSQPSNWNPPQPFALLAPLDKSSRPGRYAAANQQYGYSVQQLQQRLNEVLDPSPKLDVDGDYGPKTVEAVKRFQQERNAKPSGVADEQTRVMLGLLPAVPAPSVAPKVDQLRIVPGVPTVPGAPPVPGASGAKSIPAVPSAPSEGFVPAVMPLPAELVSPNPGAATPSPPPASPAPTATLPPARATIDNSSSLTPREIKNIIEGLMKDPYGPQLSQKDAQWVESLLLNPDRIAAYEKARQANPGADAPALWEAWKEHDPERKADEIRVLDKLIRSEVADRIRSAGIPLAPPKPDGSRSVYAARNKQYGWSVPQLQERLNDVLKPTPPLQVDGDYGPLTEAAVKEFQKQRELPVTGDVDEKTSAALGFVEPKGTLKPAAVETEKREGDAQSSSISKEGIWRLFPEPTHLNSEGWAVLAQLNVGERAPLSAFADEAAPPAIKFSYADDNELRFQVIDSARAQDEEFKINLNTSSSDHAHIRGQLVEVEYLGAADEPGAMIIVVRAEDLTQEYENINASPPTLEGAKGLLHFRTYDKLNELAATNADNGEP